MLKWKMLNEKFYINVLSEHFKRQFSKVKILWSWIHFANPNNERKLNMLMVFSHPQQAVKILSIIIPQRIAVAFATVASNQRIAFLEVVPSHDIMEKAQENNRSVILLQCCLHSFLP